MDEEWMGKVREGMIEVGEGKEVVSGEDLGYMMSDVLKEDGIENKVRVVS